MRERGTHCLADYLFSTENISFYDFKENYETMHLGKKDKVGSNSTRKGKEKLKTPIVKCD